MIALYLSCPGKGSLQEYLQWYKKSRRGPKVLEMALGSGPKNAGKKPSRRKKTNKIRATVTEVVDLMPNISAAPQHPTEQPAVQCPPPVVVSSPSIPSFVPPFPTPQQHLTQANSEAVQPCSFPTQVVPLNQENLFRLKWVAGTTVSRCYGCNGEIINPPSSVPDDLVVVYRDIRQFRERETGQLRHTTTPQNVHFHLRANCIRARYPNFPGQVPLSSLKIFGRICIVITSLG